MDGILDNYLVLGILGLAAFLLVTSAIGGLTKGVKRSIIRLILVIASFFIAFIVKDKVVESALALEIDGKTIVETIEDALAEKNESLKSLSDQIVPLLTAVISVLVFFVAYIAVLFTTWIVYLVICIFVKKGIKTKKDKANGTKGKKHALLGGLFGIVQGAFLAVSLTMPLVGLIYDLAPIEDLDLSALSQASASENVISNSIGADEDAGDTTEAEGEKSDTLDIKKTLAGLHMSLTDFCNNEYIKKDKEIIAVFDKFGYGYTNLSTAKKSDGEGTITIGGQIEAIKAVVELASKLSALSSLNFEEGFDISNAEDIQNIFNSLGSVFGEDMSEEAKETVNELINNVATELLGDAADDLPINISDIDFAGVDFETEGALIVDLMSYADPENQEEIKITDVVTNLASSTLILPILDSSDVTVDLDEGQKAEAQDAIANLPAGTSQATIDKLNALLGLTAAPEPQPEPNPSEE